MGHYRKNGRCKMVSAAAVAVFAPFNAEKNFTEKLLLHNDVTDANAITAVKRRYDKKK